ncbi:MAG TPA: ABC transporter permease subunit [Actinomycetes bacterium]|nr:ABC transporter permease subunit [Actinomycetes bacterium]
MNWLRNPWRKPRLLEALTWAYLAWSIVPVAIAVWFSFNAGRSRSAWQGFSLRWYWKDPLLSVWHDPELHRALFHSIRLAVVATAVAVPLGVAFAIGIDRWRGRVAAAFNFQMLLSFVLPEIVLAVALLFLITNLLRFVYLGTSAQLLGLVTFQLSYPVIICRARLLSIGREFEEAAMDLGASPVRAVRHVLLPLLAPAILASAVLVFADVIDDFVLVRYLSADASSEPMSVKIYNSARATPTPALNALATIMLLSSLLAVGLGFLVYRRLTRGERGAASAVREFAAQLE